MTSKFLSCAVASLVTLACSISLAQEAQPTKHHKLLARDVGDWVATMKWWPQGPAGPAVESKGKETNRMLAGLWLVSDFEGDFGGQKFEGHGTFGYDVTKNKFVGSWVDSMSPGLSTMEGTYDEKTEMLTMHSENIDPTSGKKLKGKSESRWLDDDTREFTMYSEMPGAEGMIKMMTITYKRKK